MAGTSSGGCNVTISYYQYFWQSKKTWNRIGVFAKAIYICIYIYNIYIYTCICLCVYVRTYVRTYVRMYILMCVFVYIYTCVYASVGMCEFTHLCTHKHIITLRLPCPPLHMPLQSFVLTVAHLMLQLFIRLAAKCPGLATVPESSASCAILSVYLLIYLSFYLFNI